MTTFAPAAESVSCVISSQPRDLTITKCRGLDSILRIIKQEKQENEMFKSEFGVIQNIIICYVMVIQIYIPEARCFYGFQIMMENIFSEM